MQNKHKTKLIATLKIILAIIIAVKFLLIIDVLDSNKIDTTTTPQDTVVVESPVVVDVNKMSYKEMAYYASKEFNQDGWLIYNVCKAESHFDEKADHDGGLGKGVCGIHRTTFAYWEQIFDVDLDYNSSYDQIKMTALAFSKGVLYRNQWSTYRRYVAYGVFNKYDIKNTSI